MKQHIFNHEFTCPCRAKIDMENSSNILAFINDFYGDIESMNWDNYCLEDIECAYCLMQAAIKITKSNEHKYGINKICSLITAKNCITEIFLEKTLDRIRYLLKKI